MNSYDAQQTQWEYQVRDFIVLYRTAIDEGKLQGLDSFSPETLPILLNGQGGLGWELCGIIEDKQRFIFKRRKNPE